MGRALRSILANRSVKLFFKNGKVLIKKPRLALLNIHYKNREYGLLPVKWVHLTRTMARRCIDRVLTLILHFDGGNLENEIGRRGVGGF